MSDVSASDYSLTVVKAAFGAEAVKEAFDILVSLRVKGAKLLLFTDRKFDGRKLVAVRNIEADYPADVIALRNTALIAKASGAACDYYRDGYEMLCLERALQKDVVDGCVLLRDLYDPAEIDTDWLQRNKDELFRTIGVAGKHESYVFDCRLDLTRKAISLATDFYRSGSLLSLSAPSLSYGLHLAAAAVSTIPSPAAEKLL